MAVHILEEDRKLKGVKKNLLRAWLKYVVEKNGRNTGIINFVFCSDEYLADINKKFLKKDYLTDVISFDYSKGDEVKGDIVISIDRIRENSEERGISFADEVKRVMVHGLLHLIGYNDNNKENREEMTAMEDLYLAGYRTDGKY